MKEDGDGEDRHLAGLSPENAQAVRNVAEFIIKTVNARKVQVDNGYVPEGSK